MMCVLLLTLYTAIMMTVDTIHLQWIMAYQLGRKMLSPESVDRPLKEDGAADGENDVHISSSKINGSDKPSRLRTAIISLISWLESSPRPIQDYIKKIKSAPTEPLN